MTAPEVVAKVDCILKVISDGEAIKNAGMNPTGIASELSLFYILRGPSARQSVGIRAVDLRNDLDAGQWEHLLGVCRGVLGTSVRNGFRTRRSGPAPEAEAFRESAYLWRTWLARVDREIRQTWIPTMAEIDLHLGTTASRRGLVSEILRAVRHFREVPSAPEDLVTLATAFRGEVRRG